MVPLFINFMLRFNNKCNSFLTDVIVMIYWKVHESVNYLIKINDQ